MNANKTQQQHEVFFLRALRLQLGASLAAVDARLQQLTGDVPAPAAACPRCGDPEHQAAAGDVTLCGNCNANYRGSEVIGG
jgi:ribosomal protein S27AE